MSARPLTFTSVTIEVADAAETSRFFQFHVGLEEVLVDGPHRYLRCGLEHHCVHLVESPSLERARIAALAYSVSSGDELHELAERIERWGGTVRPTEAGRARSSVASFETTDPNGMTLQFVHAPFVFAEPPVSAFGPLEMVHPFVWTDRYDESVAYYQDVIGFRPSDYIEHKLVFLRCRDRWHHSLALLRSSTFAIAHLCFLMPSLEDVMRGRARALYRNVSIPVDLVKHSASESIAIYLHDDRHGPWIELCDSHRKIQIDQDDSHEPRYMADDPRNVMDMWRAAADHDWRSVS